MGVTSDPPGFDPPGPPEWVFIPDSIPRALWPRWFDHFILESPVPGFGGVTWTLRPRSA